MSDEDICICGRFKTKPHCPYCGRLKIYGFSKPITRVNPINGEITDKVRLFRCEVCGRRFDNFQWQFDCKAPMASSARVKEQHEMTMEKWRQRAISMVKFTDNDKRAFKKAVGFTYDDFMDMWRKANDLKDKIHMRKLGLSAEPKIISSSSSSISQSSAPKIIIDDKKKLTPYQIHIESCNKFAADQQCVACDALLKLEKSSENKT
jgi:hypothetical protein